LTTNDIDPMSIMNSRRQSMLPNFWQCPNCKKIPFHLRIKNSVFFGGHIAPTNVKHPTIRTHFELCETPPGSLELKGTNIPNFDATNISYPSDNKLRLIVCKEDGRNLTSELDKSIKRRTKNTTNNQKKSEDGATSETDNLINERPAITTQKKMMKYKKKGGDGTTTPSSDILLPPPIPTRRPRRTTTTQTNPPTTASKILTRPQISFIPIPPTTNGLVHPSDKNETASIDMLLMSQLERCFYNYSEDHRKGNVRKDYLLFPDDYPGLACRHCDESSNAAPKRWFSTCGSHLAGRLPSIEQHLVSCSSVPLDIRTNIKTAKGQEAEERKRLRAKLSRWGGDKKKKISCQQYAWTVFDRLTENIESDS